MQDHHNTVAPKDVPKSKPLQMSYYIVLHHFVLQQRSLNFNFCIF